MTRILSFIAALAVVILGISLPTHAQDETPSPDEIPEAVTPLSEGEYDIVNFLLLGSDTTNPNNAGRTDVLMIVSVNRSAGTVSMLSLPRDLYVYIPDVGMNRVNTAYGFGEQIRGEGEGITLLTDTILYNLGLSIDYWARVDFNGFRQIVNDLGGLEVAVDCAIQDWRLISPELDPTLEESWEMWTLPVGIQTMDGDLALWYARSRRTSSDFDRGRRQQALMRSMWTRIRSLGLFEQVGDVFPQLLETVQTNVTVDDVLRLVDLAASIDTSRIASYTFRPNIEVRSWRAPDGASVQALNRDAMLQLVEQLFIPPTESQIGREGATIEVINASGIGGLDIVAADRLAWEGFVPVIGEPAARYQDYTVIHDFTGQSKGSSLERLQTVLRVSTEGTFIEPDPSRAYDFRVVIGGNYYSCTHPVIPPDPVLEVTPEAGA